MVQVTPNQCARSYDKTFCSAHVPLFCCVRVLGQPQMPPGLPNCTRGEGCWMWLSMISSSIWGKGIISQCGNSTCCAQVGNIIISFLPPLMFANWGFDPWPKPSVKLPLACGPLGDFGAVGQNSKDHVTIFFTHVWDEFILSWQVQPCLRKEWPN